jgi:hypothetical protein
MSSQSLPVQEPALRVGSRLGRYGRLEAQVSAHPDLIASVLVGLGFCWRVWLAQATFFNTDEAWHYSVANQSSPLAAYKASLTLAHPPLMVFVLYFWRHLGTSNVMLRLPGVVAGTIFCWVFYKWLRILFGQTVALCGLIFAAFLPPMIALSAEVRQYSWMLLFAASAAYFLERALDGNSARMMLLSSVSFYLAMLSHYSAFLFAASLGIYAILRMLSRPPAAPVMASWGAGQMAGVGLAAFLYVTHVAKLGTVYPGEPLRRFADFYLSSWYFHPGRDSLERFLWRGTFGVFRFTFGQTALGQIAALLFVAGVILLIRQKPGSQDAHPRSAAVLLMVPFFLNWIAVAAGLYPYGRTRQCIFLAIFGLTGASVALSSIARNHSFRAAALGVGIVAICQIFGTPQGRDMLPLDEQRHEHMERALQFLRSQVSPNDLVFTDKATAFQLGHYLCHQRPVQIEHLAEGFEFFRCDDMRVVASGPNEPALSGEDFVTRFEHMKGIYALNSETTVWVVQGGWSSRLGETLRGRVPEFSNLEIHFFGGYLEAFKLPSISTSPTLAPPQR